MRTQAQKKAKRKYTKEKVKQIQIVFYPKDMDLYNFAKNEGAKTGSINKFIKDLIARNMSGD